LSKSSVGGFEKGVERGVAKPDKTFNPYKLQSPSQRVKQLQSPLDSSATHHSRERSERPRRVEVERGRRQERSPAVPPKDRIPPKARPMVPDASREASTGRHRAEESERRVEKRVATKPSGSQRSRDRERDRVRPKRR
jgi:hypothetical protein